MKSWLKENWFKIAILMIFVFAVAAGLLLYMKTERDAQTLASEKFSDQQTQEQQAYVEKRQGDCLAIYEEESKKWNNVTGYTYDPSNDDCVVDYKATNGSTFTNSF